MVNNPKCEKDERAVAVENAGYSLVYKVVSYSLLLDVIYRSLVRGEAPWDLLGIVVLGGIVVTAYQARYKTLSKTWLKGVLVTVVLAAAVAVAVGFIVK